MLVQVGTRARPTGWVEREATFKGDDGKQTFHGKQVVTTGAMPWAVEETRMTLTVKNPALRTAMPLDANGNARGSLKVDSRRRRLQARACRATPCTSCSSRSEHEPMSTRSTS